MQETLRKAARWYINESGFNLQQMEEDLKVILRHRKQAFADGNLQRVYKVFAYTEIVKAAICLTIGEEYNTTFSQKELSLIKQLSTPQPETFICRKCGCEYPASAFANDSRYSNNLSKYCISCAQEIRAIQRRKAHQAYQMAGYIDQRGNIICAY